MAPTPAVAAPPRFVLLFTGHRVDAPGRTPPRFPAARVPAAERAIAQALAQLGAGPADRALGQGAAGGDLIFLQACQARGVPCEVLLPFGEDEFIARSVWPSADGPAWQARYRAVCAALPGPVRVMADECGPLPEGTEPFARCNEWLLATALAWGGIERLRFIALWDGHGGDGPGGTAHLVNEVARRGGAVTWIDTRTLA